MPVTSHTDYHAEVNKFVKELKNKQLTSSSQVALASVRLVKKLIGESTWPTASDLLKLLKEEGRQLFEEIPNETVVSNIWKRVIKIIQDESTNLEDQSLNRISSMLPTSERSHNLNQGELKPIMIEALSEIINEIETSAKNIAAQAIEHIHADEVILTMGKSHTVEAFFENAAKKRKFHIVVVENAPYMDGHELANNLTKMGLEVTLIPDSAVFTIISRINTVIVSSKSIFANGGLKAHVGTHSLALAAKHHNIPFIVISSLYKLSPDYFANSNNLPDLLPSDDVLKLNFHPNLTVLNPAFDYVPPDLITLFIFNTTKNAPSYVYRLLRELYVMENEDD